MSEVKAKVRVKEIFKKLSIVLFGLVLALTFMEVFLRIYFKEDYSVPSHRNWKFKKTWEQKYANINSLGYRDHEFNKNKDKKVFRILTLGDSMTWGVGVKDIDNLYTELLEKKLNSESKNLEYEVINAAKNGTGAEFYLNALKNEGLSLEPDLVMIGFFFNDIQGEQSNKPKPLLPEKLHWVLSRMSYVYWYSYNAMDMFINKNSYLDYYISYSSPDSKEWKRFKELWIEIHKICSENNLNIYVVLLPMLGLEKNIKEIDSVYERVGKLSEENGAKVINLFTIINQYDVKKLRVGITDAHPNERGHKLYADSIYNFLMLKINSIDHR